MGNPVQRKRTLTPDEIVNLAQSATYYVALKNRYLEG
jgi:carbonic anhydrase/acetyltransferase-like protein (isoleucine patch superfamily)